MSAETGREIPRPSVPPAAWLLAGVWSGVAAAEALWWSAEHGTPAWVAAIALGGLLAFAWWRGRMGGLVGLGVACGVLVGALFWAGLARSADEARQAGRDLLQVEALTDATAGAFSDRSVVRVVRPGPDWRVEVTWPRGEAPEAGERVALVGSLGPPARDEWARRRHRAGVVGRLTARQVERTGWARSLRGLVGPWRLNASQVLARVPGEGAALVSGVVLGDRRRLAGTAADDDFRTTGLTHLVAVSGGHLVVVAALVTWLAGQAALPRWVRMITTLSVLALYVAASGMQASAVRAFAMSAVATVALVGARRADTASALTGAACVALALHPPMAFDLGFQLSVAAVAGLVIFARLADEWVGAALPVLLRPVGAPVGLTLVAQAATVPLTVSTFGTLSLISPVANVVAGPLVSVVLVVGLVAACLAPVWPGAAEVLFRGAAAAGGMTCSAAHALAAIPGAAIPLGLSAGLAAVVTGLVAAGLWVAWPRPQRWIARLLVAGLALATVVAAVGPRPPAGISVVALDVGQGDAILVRDGAHTMLIDAGPDPAVLRQALTRHGVRRVETLVVTHVHDDHYGGAPGLKGVVPVDSLVVARGAAAELPRDLAALGATVSEVEAGGRLDCGSIDCEVLAPAGTTDEPSANESSLVLVVQANDRTVLITGDAEDEVLAPLAARGVLPDVEVFKVGHHGSAGAVGDQALAALLPETAVISVGQGNRYGHPDPATVARLAAAGCRVQRTDREGDVWMVGGP